MKVSVIIPLYNKEATIERAIRSVLSQSYADYELIIINDGSTDASASRVQPFLSKNVRMTTQRNAGPGAARNAGADQAAGELLAFLDADDEWRPAFLEAAVKRLQSFPRALAYVCGYDALEYRDVRPNKVISFASPVPNMPNPNDGGLNIKMRCDAMHSSACVVRKTAFTASGGFYGKDRCVYGEDSYFWMSVLLSGPVFWDAAEHSVFHVEDSALGFAQQTRKVARPLSIYAPQSVSRVDQAYAQTLLRAAEVYAEMDVNALWRSKAYMAVFQLLRIYPDLRKKYSLATRVRRRLQGLAVGQSA